MLCRASKIRGKREIGTRGRAEPVEMSQRAEKSLEGMKTARREGLLRRAVVSWQEGCKEDSLKKFTVEVEGRGCMAETGNFG